MRIDWKVTGCLPDVDSCSFSLFLFFFLPWKKIGTVSCYKLYWEHAGAWDTKIQMGSQRRDTDASYSFILILSLPIPPQINKHILGWRENMYKITLTIKNKTIRSSWIYCVKTWNHVFIHNKMIFLHATGPDCWSHKTLESWLKLSSQTLRQPAGTGNQCEWSPNNWVSKVTECAGRGATGRACFSQAPPSPFQMVFTKCCEAVSCLERTSSLSRLLPICPLTLISSVISSRNCLSPTRPLPQLELTPQPYLTHHRGCAGLCPRPSPEHRPSQRFSRTGDCSLCETA